MMESRNCDYDGNDAEDAEAGLQGWVDRTERIALVASMSRQVVTTVIVLDARQDLGRVGTRFLEENKNL